MSCTSQSEPINSTPIVETDQESSSPVEILSWAAICALQPAATTSDGPGPKGTEISKKAMDKGQQKPMKKEKKVSGTGKKGKGGFGTAVDENDDLLYGEMFNCYCEINGGAKEMISKDKKKKKALQLAHENTKSNGHRKSYRGYCEFCWAEFDDIKGLKTHVRSACRAAVKEY